MFGLFKKKTPPASAAPAGRIVRGAANLLDLALTLCRSTNAYQEKLQSKFVRGYLIGFFDGAIQCAGIQIQNDDEFLALMIFGHASLLAQDVPNPTAYILES